MCFRSFLIFISAIIFNYPGFSQQFGGNPPSVKWEQVNNPAVKVIFQKGMDSTANRVANVIAWLDKTIPNTIGLRKRKVNLVLQNQTTISNAYVSLAPFRSEFYLTPEINSFELGSLPWPDQLAIHEFRHVQQYNNFNVGISHIMKILFGEDGQALANGAAIPNWFFEGDAVYNETNVSNQGRGRLPLFYSAYRSLWMANKKYSWMKLRNGSYRDFTPDHYALGYLLVSYGREKYGDEFWKNVTHDAAAFKGLFYPFQKAIKKYSGKDYTQFRNDALTYFKTYFSASISSPGSPQKHEYTNEEYPCRISSDELLFVKSGYKKIPAFYIRTPAGDRKVRTRDVSLDNYFSYRNGQLVYASLRPDVRWNYRDYSDLRILDIKSGIEHSITNHSKYFTPDLSPDGQQVIATRISPDGFSSLHVLNSSTGALIETIPNGDNLFYTYPKYITSTKVVCAVRNQQGKMSLAIIHLPGGRVDYLTGFSYEVIGFPSVSNDTIYFSKSKDKDDQLFAYTIPDKKTYLLHLKTPTNGVGNYQPVAFRDKICFTIFTAEGFKIRELSVNAFQWEEQPNLPNVISSFGIDALTKSNANELSLIPNEKLPVKRYSKLTGLINFHSVQPDVNDPEYTITLLGENILNTFQSNLAVTYNRAEQWKRVSFSAISGSLFPYISGGVNYTMDRRGLYHGKVVYWNEIEPFAGLSVDLNLSKNRSSTRLNFGTSYTYNQRYFQGVYKDSLAANSYGYLNNILFFSHQSQQSKQQIFPAFAQTLTINYKTAVSRYKGSQFMADANIYLPGFLRNHSLVLNAAFLAKDTMNQLNFSSSFPFSRGYSSINLHQMFKWGATYHLPLFYPDAGIANIIYFSRIRGNVFYDETDANDFYSSGGVFKANFRSVGGEVYFDTKWWNQAVLTFGIRYSHLLDPDIFGTNGNSNRWELILPVNIFQQ